MNAGNFDYWDSSSPLIDPFGDRKELTFGYYENKIKQNIPPVNSDGPALINVLPVDFDDHQLATQEDDG